MANALVEKSLKRQIGELEMELDDALIEKAVLEENLGVAEVRIAELEFELGIFRAMGLVMA